MRMKSLRVLFLFQLCYVDNNLVWNAGSGVIGDGHVLRRGGWLG